MSFVEIFGIVLLVLIYTTVAVQAVASDSPTWTLMGFLMIVLAFTCEFYILSRGIP
jgi:hypothetical protein